MRIDFISASAAAAALLSACDPAKTSLPVDRVRVLAIRAEPASVRPGDAIHLEALVASPVEGDADIEVRWYLCQYADVEDCAKATDLQQIGTGRTLDQTIPPQAFPGDVMVYWLDAIKDGSTERALKAVYIRGASEPVNLNPAIRTVAYGDGGPFDRQIDAVKVDGRIDVHMRMEGIGNEIWMEAGSPASEDLHVDTYTTGGFLVDPSGTGASGELYYRAPAAGGRFGAWVVVNDGRGGTDWHEHWITVPKEKVQR